MLAELLATFRATAKPAIAVMAVAALLWIPAARSVHDSRLLTQTDTRTLAENWIETHIPPGTTIGIEGLKIKPVKGTVQLQDSAENIRERIEYWRKREPKQAKFLEYELQAVAGPNYDLELITRADAKPLSDYVCGGVRYFVIRPTGFVSSRRTSDAAEDLLQDLGSDPRVHKIKGFYPDPDKTPGPAIEIYAVDQPPAGCTDLSAS
jgi:hypothetical protein